MRIPLAVAALAAALAGSTPTASAQPAAAPRAKTFGLEGAVAVPTEDGINLWLGALARIHVPTSPNLTITGRTGLMYALVDDNDFDISITAIPLYGGVTYSLVPAGGLYLAGEAGLTIIRASASFGGQSNSESETELGLSLGAGYKQGQIDGRIALWFPSLDETDTLSIMATVGFDIASF